MGTIAITCGDPSGVGPEIIGEWMGRKGKGNVEVCLIGPSLWLEKLKVGNRCSTLTVGPDDFRITPGEPSEMGAKLALEALEEAAEGCLTGRFSAVVTGPVSKERMHAVGFSFPGQTEFFAARWGGQPTMAFVGARMRLVLMTWHVPLKGIFEQLTRTNIERAVIHAVDMAYAFGAEEPRIGICGLNPHAGEGGLLGEEERDVINPVLEELRRKIPGLSSAQPADTLFHRHVNGEFDVVVALYHDQGLVAAKTLEFESTVNLTLGLPWVRTSPDHGTGFTIAGKGLASSSSFEYAVSLALRLQKLTATT